MFVSCNTDHPGHGRRLSSVTQHHLSENASVDNDEDDEDKEEEKEGEKEEEKEEEKTEAVDMSRLTARQRSMMCPVRLPRDNFLTMEARAVAESLLSRELAGALTLE